MKENEEVEENEEKALPTNEANEARMAFIHTVFGVLFCCLDMNLETLNSQSII